MDRLLGLSQTGVRYSENERYLTIPIHLYMVIVMPAMEIHKSRSLDDRFI